MSGLLPVAPTLTARQIAAKLNAIGFSAAQSDALALIYTNQLALIFELTEQGIELPESLTSQLDGFDPDEQANPEGMTP